MKLIKTLYLADSFVYLLHNEENLDKDDILRAIHSKVKDFDFFNEEDKDIVFDVQCSDAIGCGMFLHRRIHFTDDVEEFVKTVNEQNPNWYKTIQIYRKPVNYYVMIQHWSIWKFPPRESEPLEV